VFAAVNACTMLCPRPQIFSGTFCVIGETVSHHSLYDDADVEAGEWLAAHTPIDARFLTTSEGTHVRPVRDEGSCEGCEGCAVCGLLAVWSVWSVEACVVCGGL
jgi:hypothetical protein